MTDTHDPLFYVPHAPIEHRRYAASALHTDGRRLLVMEEHIDTDYGSWDRLSLWYDVHAARHDSAHFPADPALSHEVVRLVDGAFVPLTSEDEEVVPPEYGPRRGYVAVAEVDGRMIMSGQFVVTETYHPDRV